MSNLTKKSAIVLFMPVIHQGYINFLEYIIKEVAGNSSSGYSDNLLDVLLFDTDIVADFIKVERHLRTMSSETIQEGLKAIIQKKSLPIDHVLVLSKKDLEHKTSGNFFESYQKIFLPKEDVSEGFASTYLTTCSVDFVNRFLRWDKIITTTEHEVPPHRIISAEDVDVELMNKAFELKEKSSDWWRQIGVLCVKDSKILAHGFNEHAPSKFALDLFGDPRSNFDAGERIDLSTAIHAEAGLIARAAQKGISLDGSSVYVTTFPCPNCAKLIAVAGIKKVYYSQGYSLLDAEEILSNAKIEIILVK